MLITMAGFALGKWSSAVKPSTQSSHPGPTVQQIQQLSTLVTTRIETSDVQETGVQGFSGGMKVALVVKGGFLLGVNLGGQIHRRGPAAADSRPLASQAPCHQPAGTPQPHTTVSRGK